MANNNSYADCPYSVFPQSVDTIPRKSDLGATSFTDIQRYNQYIQNQQWADAINLINTSAEVRSVVVSAEDLNRLRDGVVATEKFFLDELEDYVIEVVHPKGTWSSTTAYSKYDVVQYAVTSTDTAGNTVSLINSYIGMPQQVSEIVNSVADLASKTPTNGKIVKVLADETKLYIQDFYRANGTAWVYYTDTEADLIKIPAGTLPTDTTYWTRITWGRSVKDVSAQSDGSFKFKFDDNTEESVGAGVYDVMYQNIEGWARGTRGGVPVTPGQTGYQDNAKYYKQLAERYANGKEDGTPVASGEGYHDNSMYYKDLSEDAADRAEAAAGGVEYPVSYRVHQTLSATDRKTARTNITSAGKRQFVTSTMTAANWDSVNKTYSFETSYPSTTYNVDVEIAPNATAAQYRAFSKAYLSGSATTNVMTAIGTVPTVDIPIILTVEEF